MVPGEQSVYNKVKLATIKGAERDSRIFGGIDVDFVCDPYTYLVSGDIAIEPGTITNPTLVVSHPIYKIEGEGMCTLTVNGKTMVANVGQNITIDTDRPVSYTHPTLPPTPYLDTCVAPLQLTINT